MKTSKQIVGLPIISINDGKELGTVKSLVVNPEQGTIDFITVHHEDWQISVKAVPYKKVIGVGDYALTVESEMNIIDLTEIPIANTLVTKNIKIIGARIMSKKGQLLGQVVEYHVNDDNGTILGLELTYKDETVLLSREYVHTYGKDILIVNEDAEQHFLSNAEELSKRKVAAALTEEGDDSSLEMEKETFINGNSLSQVNKEDLSKAFLDRQIALLEGKVVTSDIHSKSGELLVNKGTKLTKDLILAVNSDGPSGMVELSMNVEMD